MEELQTEVGKLQDERDGYVEKIALLDSTVADQRAELETLKKATGDDVAQLKEALERESAVQFVNSPSVMRAFVLFFQIKYV